MMLLIIARHGKTHLNKKQVLIGRTDDDLSSEGRKQAALLGKRLKNEKIDAIYSSDYKRAMDTAKEISRNHDGIEVLVDERLRERDFGEFEAKTKQETDWLNIRKEYIKNPSKSPKGGESLNNLFERTRGFVDHIIKEHRNETVVIVCHNYVALTILSIIKGLSPEQIDDIGKLKNAAVSILEITEDGNHKIHVHNCTKHLE